MLVILILFNIKVIIRICIVIWVCIQFNLHLVCCSALLLYCVLTLGTL